MCTRYPCFLPDDNPTTSTLKFEKKELFSSRLAGVKAQTLQHAKMKIVKDFVKFTCNRFDIDSKEILDDPDPFAQSKSSSRESAEGDENVDWKMQDCAHQEGW